MPSEHESKNEPTWDTRTGVQNLLRNRVSGKYYSRVMVGGKRRMRSLNTTIFSVAQLRHNDEIGKALRQRTDIVTLTEGGGTMGLLIEKLETDYMADTAKSNSRTRQRLPSEHMGIFHGNKSAQAVDGPRAFAFSVTVTRDSVGDGALHAQSHSCRGKWQREGSAERPIQRNSAHLRPNRAEYRRMSSGVGFA